VQQQNKLSEKNLDNEVIHKLHASLNFIQLNKLG